jgi:hypothetical protein
MKEILGILPFHTVTLFRLLLQMESFLLPIIFKEIKGNMGNACYHSVQKLLSSRLLFKNIKIRICKTIIFACDSTWV